MCFQTCFALTEVCAVIFFFFSGVLWRLANGCPSSLKNVSNDIDILCFHSRVDAMLCESHQMA